MESVQALAKQFGDFAHDVESASRSLNSFGSDAAAMQWIGKTADAFKAQYGPLPGRLQKLYTSYSEASDALSAYWPALQAAQNKADSALRQAQDANADLQRASVNATNTANDLKTTQQNHAANPNPQAVTDAQNAHTTAQNNLTNAKATMAALTKQANDAYNDRITAATACGHAIGKAQSDGIHNQSWWHHLGQELSDIGGEIADIANEIAPILDIIALATSWIPGLDVITAGLAEADNIIALVGTGMQIAGDAMQGHWGDALLGAGMLGLQFAGGKAFEKFGGKALESLGGKARSAEGNLRAIAKSDPVDVVSGWMLTDATDVELAGVLPLVLRRAYVSGYETGRLFGAGWSSTLDQRLAVNEVGIHFVGDDAQRLDYPMPSAGQEVLPERGDRWPLIWDRDSDEIRISDPWNGLTRHFGVVHYRDEIGQIRDLMAISDRNGNRVVIERDENGTPTAVVHAAYRILVDTLATAAGPRVVRLRLADGSEDGATVKSFRYDERGRLTGVVWNASELPFTYEWGEDDRITAWQDRSGYRYAYHYDEFGRVVRGEGAFLAGTFEYDPENRTTVVTNSLGHATTYIYDENGHVCSETDPLGHTQYTESDLYDRVVRLTDATGATTAFTRDENGDVRRVVAPGGLATELTYNRFHRVVLAVGPDGATWRRAHDERGNLVEVVDPAGAVTRFEHTAAGALAATTDPLGALTRFTTDAAGLALTSTDPLGAAVRATRDAAGRVLALTDPVGATTSFRWSADGLPVSRTGPDGTSSHWEYDAGGRLVRSVNAIGTATVYEPGPMGTLIASTGPDGVRYAFDYDGELRLRSVTNPGGASWRYAYDAANRLIGESDFIGRTLGYEYDAAGALSARITGLGQRIGLERDAAGRVTRRQSPEGEYVYCYDTAGRLVSATGPGDGSADLAYEYDLMGRILSESVDGRSTQYTYDAVGRRIRRVTASGVESTWTYDAAGRAAGLTAGMGQLEYAFDAAGHEVQRALGAAGAAQAWLTREYDVAGRPVAQRLTAGAGLDGATVLSRSWAWRADGVPEEVHDSLRGTRRFVSDAAGRPTAVCAQGWSEAFAYDAFGNVTAAGGGGGAGGAATEADEPSVTSRALIRQAGRTHHDYDDAGRLVRTTRRTLDGRQKTWLYTWDSQDRLVQAQTPEHGTWRYVYDPTGRRTAKVRLGEDGRGAERTLFSWEDSRLAEQTALGPDGTNVTLTWDYDPDTYRPAAQRRRSWVDGAEQGAVDEVFHAVVTDLVGTPAELIGADGHVAWRTTGSLWGRTVDTAGEDGLDCPIRFPGQYHDDETGLHYNLNRYYDPDTAAYLTPDPLGLAPSPNDRGYVVNPLTYADPLGLYEVSAEGIDHVINGVVTKDGKFAGWHMHPDQTGGIPDNRFISGKMVTRDDGSVKVVDGTVGLRYPDHSVLPKESTAHTFFPADWTKQDIIDAGNHVLNNGTLRKRGSAMTGEYKGVKIFGYLEVGADQKKTFSSWFPD
ncbi:RHS repeat-associated core domain-containing protein [Catenulispora pinistramenti]|uniref:RHS repeat-associated core domain-containing protein n=1 Tax=Catenulispora pinistramenti TaxID=2705254 RepID=UPI002E7AAB21|nr:RHS repeat-associated core domain-containing protein [Catenulispora pinistramenti]